MKNVIVTGAAGFIGSHVARELVAKGFNVLAIDDLSGGSEDNIPEGATFENVSINSESIADIFKSFKPDVVYHLAAYAAEGLSHHIPVFNYHNNVIGTVNVLNASYHSGAKHFVFTSSIAAYGHPHDSTLFDEETHCSPCDPYGTAKLACELHIKGFCDYFEGMTYTIFRPHNVFGPNQNIADPYRNVVGIFFLKAFQNLSMPIFGDGSQSRSFSYINVVAQSIANAPLIEAAKNQTFNIGGDEAMSVKDLAGEISKVVGNELKIDFLPERKEVQHAHCSHEKARHVFNDIYTKNVRMDIIHGLQLMYQDLKTNFKIPEPTECPAEIEIFDNLPKSWLSRLAEKTVAI